MADISTAKKRFAIDTDGDVVLRLSGADLRVSSKALSLASKVFQAMLSPRYAEGSTIRNGIITVDMPEDDKEAMVTLCSVLHHRYEYANRSQTTTSSLSDLAIAADKYDCVSAVSQWTGNHLSDLIQSAGTSLDYRLLYLTYAFDDYRRFQQVTRLLVYSRSSVELLAAIRDSIEEMEKVDKPSLWIKVICKVLETQETTMRSLLAKLEDALAPLLGKELSKGGPNTKSGMCHYSYYYTNCDSTHIGKYILEMRRQSMWPLAQVGGTLDVNKMLSKLSDCLFQPMTKQVNCLCENYNMDFAKIIYDAGQNNQKAFSGLCLDCVKRGRPDKKDGEKCRIAHEGYLGI